MYAHTRYIYTHGLIYTHVQGHSDMFILSLSVQHHIFPHLPFVGIGPPSPVVTALVPKNTNMFTLLLSPSVNKIVSDLSPMPQIIRRTKEEKSHLLIACSAKCIFWTYFPSFLTEWAGWDGGHGHVGRKQWRFKRRKQGGVVREPGMEGREREEEKESLSAFRTFTWLGPLSKSKVC